MIRDDNSSRTRYGYIRSADVPVSKRADAAVNESDRDGLLKVAGEFSLFAIGSIVGGAVIRSSSRSILNSVSRFGSRAQNANSQWLRAAGRTVAGIKSEAMWLDDVMRRIEGVATVGKSSVSYFETLKDSEKFTAHGVRPDYLKKLAVSRAASYARRAPYELPAAYITQRYLIERERTKQEIAEGRFNPLNPLDTIGDFAIKSASLIAGDMALHMASPMGKAFDEMLTKTNASYATNKAAIKVANQAAVRELLKFTDNARLVTRATVTSIKDVAHEINLNPSRWLEQAERDLTSVDAMRDPVRLGFRRTKAEALHFGKRVARELKEERYWQSAYGHARDATPTARLGTSVKIISGIDTEDTHGVFTEAVYGRYLKGVEDNLIAQGLDPETAALVVDANKSNFTRTKIVDVIRSRANGDMRSGAGINVLKDTSGSWGEKMEGAIDIRRLSQLPGLQEGMNPTELLENMLRSASGLPDTVVAGSWIRDARSYTNKVQKIITSDFIKKQGRAKVDLRRTPLSRSRADIALREDMALEAFDALGVDIWGRREMKNFGLWGAWKAQMPGVDDLEERTKTFLVNRGRAYDTPLGGLNWLGLQRLTAPQMVALENERRKLMLGGDSEYGKHASMFGDERMVAYKGLDKIRETAGPLAAKRMLGERGLYMSATGDIVDARWLHDMPRRALEWTENNLQIPVVGINPLSMFGTSSWMAGVGQDVKLQSARGGYFERRMIKNLDIDKPMFQVGRKTYGSVDGKIRSVGNWTWFANDNTKMLTGLARKVSHEPAEAFRRPEQMRGFFGGKWFMKKGPGGELIQTPLSKLMQSLDFEQGAEKSIPHNIWRRLNRSGSLRKRLSYAKKHGVRNMFHATTRNDDFLSDWFTGMVRRGNIGESISTPHDRKGMSLLQGGLSRNTSQESSIKIKQILEDLRDIPRFDEGDPDSVKMVLKQLKHRANEPDLVNSKAQKELQRLITQVEDVTGIRSSKILDRARLNAPADITDTMDRTARVKHVVAQKVAEARLVITRATDSQHFDDVWDLIAQMRRDGQISETTFQKMRSTMAAVDLRVTKRTADYGNWTKNKQTVDRVREAIGHLVGPGKGRAGVSDIYQRAGTPFQGMRGVFESTLGNKGWRSAAGSVIEDNPPALNPFSGSTWVGLPSFSSQAGFTGGLRELGGILSGKFVNEATDLDSDPLKAFSSIFFGDVKKGNITMGTLAGTHLVGRVAEAIDTIGLGLQAWKYNNPADLFLRGLIMKRAVPTVLAVGALDMIGGLPIIGKAGVMGAAATAVGPGLGMARASIFQATGLNKFFGTFSEVTNQDEDAESRKLARTPEEELQFWRTGEVPIRQGRWWTLGNTRWKGGKVNYYRPNWYRMYMSDYKYNDSSPKEGLSGKSLRGSRLEHAMFGTDLSPLRPLDPYHYERKHKEDRPYPVTGDYFTGPWGPLTPLANATIGSVLKPKRLMHQDDATTATLLTRTNMTIAMQAFESGRINIGQVTQLAAANMARADEYLEEINRRHVRSGPRSSVRQMVRTSQRINDANLSASGSGTSQAIIAGLNSTQTDSSGRKIGTLGGKYATGEGYIPAKYMYLLGKTPYPNYSESVPLMSQAMKPGTMNYRLGEFGYMAQEWGGFYGFMAGGIREVFGGSRDMSPGRPVMQSADRMYGAERAFWDLDLGGLGDLTLSESSVQMSEIVRRFIPHRRRDINEVNDIPNNMPYWLPGEEDVINYKTGDPYVKIKLGEARLPGAGYEALNNLHPDAVGSYGTFDRFKILADIAPWSNEYNLYKKALEKSDLTDEMRKQVTEIKKQVAERRKKIPVSEYMWQGRLGEVASGQLAMNSEDPNLFTMPGVDAPIRLAGVRFSKTGEGKRQAEAFFKTFLEGRNVSIRADKNGDLTRDNRERTMDAIVMAGGKNINRIALDRIRRGQLAGSEAQSKQFVDNMVRYKPEWQAFGKLWEKVAHAEIPIIGNKFGRRSAAEHYERRMVYGKTWQPWETPVKSFLEPMWQTYTRDRGLLSIPIGAALTGWAAGMFAQAHPLKGQLRLIGAIAGGTVAGMNQIRTLTGGQRNVPTRRKREWAIDEYVDILNYLKWSNLYSQARRAAVEQEGVDPESIVELLGESAANRREEYEKEWKSGPIGRKPDKPAAEKVFANIGPITSEALQYRRRMVSTMFGSDMSDDFMTATSGIPKRYQPLVEGLLATPKGERERLLDIMPKPMRRIFQQQWGMPVEKGRELAEYFKTHELPGPDWEGWMPQVDMEEIKMKIVNNEGLDSAEYGYYPSQMEESLAQPWSYPDFHGGPRMSEDQIIEQLQAMGVRDIQISRSPVHGAGQFFVNLTHDRRSEVMRTLNERFA